MPDAASGRSPADEALALSELRYRRLFETAKDGILILDAETGMVVDVNPFLIEMVGYSHDQFVRKAVWELGFLKDAIASRDKFIELQRQEYVRYENLPLETAGGKRIDVEFVSNVYLVGRERVIQCNIRDITARRRAESRQALVTQMLAMLNGGSDIRSLVGDLLRLIKAQAGIEAIGIRLREGDDFPYYATDGFPDDFAESERHLCARDAAGELVRDSGGQPVLECMCGSVLSGRFDPTQPFFTANGSFWTNSAAELPGSALDPGGQARMRSRCSAAGYESVALIPIRSDSEVIGLLQFNDRRKGMLTLEIVSFFERIGASIGIALTRQRAAKALEESTAFLNTLLDAIPVPVFYKNMEGRYIGCNQAFATFHGKPREELLGRAVFDIAPPELAEVYRAKDLELYRNPGVQVYDARVKDGQGLMHEVVYHKAVFRDSSGAVGGLIGVMIDVTERLKAEQSNARLATAVEQSAETIVITERDGTILYANPSFERTTGYTREEAVGQNPRILKSGKQSAEFYRRMWAALTAGQVWTGNMINRRKDGALYEEEASISPVRDAAGRIVNYVAVKRDVTSEVQLKDQLRQAQKLEAVGRLAGGVAHDYNNLLMGIMNYVELCRDQIDPAHPIRPWLDEIMHDARRSAEITRQLLAFARKQTILPKVLDLNVSVAGMLKLLRRLIGEDISLAWRPGTPSGLVQLDPAQADQILANLCVNARDAIGGVGQITLETGSITLDADYCASHADAIPGEYVFLAVSDNGCGMDADTLAHVFEPFFTTKGLGMGTGLGLATVYGIVKQNNGLIYVYSEPGQGTTVKLYLPRAATSAVEPVEAAAALPPRGRGETILLVEDEKSLRVTCSLFLEALGYTVLVAETPGDALRLAERHPGDIDLLQTDVVMPGMDGRQLAQRLCAARPGVRVLFMSGYTADVIAQRGVLEQNQSFIAKPFTRHELAHKVRDVLETRPAAPESS